MTPNLFIVSIPRKFTSSKNLLGNISPLQTDLTIRLLRQIFWRLHSRTLLVALANRVLWQNIPVPAQYETDLSDTRVED